MELYFDNISKRYENEIAIDNFNTTITDGIYGLLGPNGSGKTTLINMVANILIPDSGRILFNGNDIKDIGTKYLENIGYLPQYPMFYRNFKVGEFLKYMCILKNIPRRLIKERIDEVLNLVNLKDSYKKKIGALSGGMRQRLGVAQAILNNPNILVLDEPTSGLDPIERIRFRNLIARISKGKIILISTHIVSDIEHIAKEFIILKKGKLVVKNTPKKLIKNFDVNVWTVISSNVEIENYARNFSIRNIKPVGDKYKLWIVCKDKPVDNANLVETSIEDVYLSIFGDLN